MNPIQMLRVLVLCLTLIALGAACGPETDSPPTARKAEEFIAEAEAALLESWITRERATWVQANFITEDTDRMAADAGRRTMELTVDLAKRAARFDSPDLDGDLARKLAKLKVALTLPAPAGAAEELAGIAAAMKSAYGHASTAPRAPEWSASTSPPSAACSPPAATPPSCSTYGRAGADSLPRCTGTSSAT